MEHSGANGHSRDKDPAETPAEWGDTIHQVLVLVGRKWVVAVFLELLEGPRRHFQLLRAIDVQPKVLRDTLRFLEDDGVVERVLHDDDVGGKSVAYQLTDLGHSLVVPMGALFDWGRDHLASRP